MPLPVRRSERMLKNANKLRIVISLIFIIGVVGYGGPGYALAQQGDSGPNIQNLILNGGFEGGFQEDFGIGYGWGGFSNGNATVGWNFDDWAEVVVEGKYAQRIEIRDALELDRYAGIYQTISVVPGEQYKLTIKGLIRSTEGDIEQSDYGYRLQYAVDYNGGTAWELVNSAEWKELPWDEQPMTDPPGGAFRVDTYETTITATGDKLTLFIRGWKKWLNNGSGVFNLDEISFVGPAPEGFQAPVAEAASVGAANEQPAQQNAGVTEPAEAQPQPEAGPQAEVSTEAATDDEASTEVATEDEAATQTDASGQSQISVQGITAPQSGEATQPEAATLPVSGRGSDNTINYVLITGVTVLLVLLAGAIMATVRKRSTVE